MNRSSNAARALCARSKIALVLAAVLCLAAGFSAFAGTAVAAPKVIVIDAGHQGKANLGLEPVGPGSKTKKPKVAGGASGVSTHKAESLVNLQVAKRLAAQLKKRGFKVIMIRTSQNVNIPNSARAKVANKAKATLIIHLHCDSAGSSTKGLLVIVPGKDKWTSPILTSSTRAGKAIQKFTLASTGAHNRGISKRIDLVGLNYSTVPSVFVEMGLMSNPAEDKRLSTASYQDKLAVGMANGIKAYVVGK